jgi:CRISPR/Cas system endoribonuclease Cas6 (RAMP superfamily)
VIGPSAQTAGLLKLGELIQAGKQTTFGLGKYEIL